MRSHAQRSATPQSASRARPAVAPEPKLRRPRPARIDDAAPVFDFSGIPPYAPLTPPRIHTKLAIGAPRDEFEQEADRIAEQVMRMPEPQAPSKGRARESELANAPAAKVRTKTLGTNDVGGIEAPPIVHEVLNSPGQPLDAATRAFMEPRFGRDFSKVRVHMDAKAGHATQAVGARAFATGNNLAFNVGEYSPDTDRGRALLAHELAHTIQGGALIRMQPKSVQTQHVEARKASNTQTKKADDNVAITANTTTAAEWFPNGRFHWIVQFGTAERDGWIIQHIKKRVTAQDDKGAALELKYLPNLWEAWCVDSQGVERDGKDLWFLPNRGPRTKGDWLIEGRLYFTKIDPQTQGFKYGTAGEGGAGQLLSSTTEPSGLGPRRLFRYAIGNWDSIGHEPKHFGKAEFGKAE